MARTHRALVLRRDCPAWDRHPSRRSRVRGQLRDLANTDLRKRTGLRRVRMSYTTRGYAKRIVAGLGVVLVGWPARIPFRNLSHIPGGVRPLVALRRLWQRGTLRFERASKEVRKRALRDPKSVLPGGPLPPLRLSSPEESDVEPTNSAHAAVAATADDGARILPGSMAAIPTPAPTDAAPAPASTAAVAPAVASGAVVRALVLAPDAQAQVGMHPMSTSTRPLPTKASRAQRFDFGKGRVRPVTNPLNMPLRRPRPGVKSARYVLEDASGTRFWGVDDPIEDIE